MANHSEVQFPTGSTTFFAIVSTINESMTEKLTESTILSTLLDSTTANVLDCVQGYLRCDDQENNKCVKKNSICCRPPHDYNDIHCICYKGFKGLRCHGRDTSAERSTGYEGAHLTAVISALIGVLVISLFVGVVVLQYKYYKQRKKRLHKDEEIRKSMRVKPEIKRRDDASTRLLRTQPGYSWRQSVKRSTYVSQKSNGLSMSISVPENLFEIGLFREREKETNQTKSSNGGGGGGGRREGGGEEEGEAEGSERICIDPAIDESEVNSSSTVQLFQDIDPPRKAVQFQNNSDVVHL